MGKTKTAKRVFYVSPSGDDGADGKTADTPFRSVGKAKEAVRKALKRNGSSVIDVVMRGGVYPVSQTLSFDENDAPGRSGSVTWSAFGDEKPVVSGGIPIANWEDCGHGIVKAVLPDRAKAARVLYVNGTPVPSASLPLEGMYTMDKNENRAVDWASYVRESEVTGLDRRSFRYKKGDLSPDIPHLDELEVVVYQFWTEARLKIVKLDEKNRAVLLTDAAWRPLSWSFGYRLDNAYGGLANKGRSFFSRAENAVYYSLRDGETAEKLGAFVPGLTELIKIKPGKGKLFNLNFRGVTFSHTDGYMPPEGHAYAQAELGAPNAVYLENAENCRFERCVFENLGACCLWLGKGCGNCAVVGCDFHGFGAGAVRVGEEKDAKSDEDDTSGILISENRIRDGGLYYLGSAAVWIGQSGRNTVSRNDITGAFQWAVSVGWNWAVFPLTRCRDNIIEKNHIHTLGTGVLGTHGAIYALGVSPGTYIRNNLIADVRSNEFWDAGEGIVLDNGCANVIVENNVVYAASAGGWGCNFNCFGNLVANNIFAYGEKFQLTRYGDAPQSLIPPPNGEIFTKNIVVWEKGPLLKETRWHSYTTYWDYNLYYDASGAEIKFLTAGLDEWRKLGLDANSLIADPKITFAPDGTYRLAPDSPAYAIGFRDIDLDGVPM